MYFAPNKYPNSYWISGLPWCLFCLRDNILHDWNGLFLEKNNIKYEIKNYLKLLFQFKTFIENSDGIAFRISLWGRKGYQYFPAFLAHLLCCLNNSSSFLWFIWSMAKDVVKCPSSSEHNYKGICNRINVLTTTVATWRYKFWSAFKKKSVSLLYYHASHFDIWISYCQWMLITNWWEITHIS